MTDKKHKCKISRKHDRVAEPSALQRLFRLLEKTCPLRINFEDLSGITYDVPDLKLAEPYHIHCCAFCMLVKRHRADHKDCVRNKRIVNHLTMRKHKGFVGQCHLGLTELVEPLIYRERVLGVFYFGSVVVQGTETAGRLKIRNYAQRSNRDPAPLLAAFARVPRIRAAEVAGYWERLRLVTVLAERILDSYGLPLKRYRTAMIAVGADKDIPPLVQSAMRYVHRNCAEPLTVSAVAKQLHCHPDYLSRTFKQSVCGGLADYILRVRVDQARHLITMGKLSLGEIAWQVGFKDQSHFCRVFKRLVGVAPGSYQEVSPARHVPEQ